MNVTGRGRKQLGGASQVLSVDSDDEDNAPLVAVPAARAAAGGARRASVVAAAKCRDEFSISDDEDFDF